MTACRVRISVWCAVFFATVLLGLVWNGRLFVRQDRVLAEKRTSARNGLALATESFDGSEIPSSWSVSEPDEHSRGWRQSGFAPLSAEDVKCEIDAMMARCGYTMRHCVGDDNMLLQYENGSRGKIMWSLSPVPDGRTFFSWGISR